MQYRHKSRKVSEENASLFKVSKMVPAIPNSLDETGIMAAINLYDKMNEWGELVTSIDTADNRQARSKCKQSIMHLLNEYPIEINRSFCICEEHPFGRTSLSILALISPVHPDDIKLKWNFFNKFIEKGARYPPPIVNNRTLILEMATKLLIDPQPAVLDLLLSLGADLNEQDLDGNSILHLAVQNVVRSKENFHIIEFLCTTGISYGLDPYIRNHHGKQAIDDSLGFGFFRRKDTLSFSKIKEYLVAATQVFRPRYEEIVMNLATWRFPKDICPILFLYMDLPSLDNPKGKNRNTNYQVVIPHGM